MQDTVHGGVYGKKHLMLISMESVLANDRIFVGNQPDDFALAGFLAPGNRVLMLGLGYGGAIRSLIAGVRDIELHIVDYDASIIKSCSSLFADVFPEISNAINYVHGDASCFDELIQGKFDAICIDTYTDEGYPDFLFSDDFWEKVKHRLTSNGVAIINSMGLPTHLHPLQGDTPQARLVNQLKVHMNHVYSLPYRRSLTLVCSNDTPQLRSIKPQYPLKKFDELIFNLFPLRWTLATKSNMDMKPSKYTNYVSGIRTDIDQEMNARWSTFIQLLSKGLVACGFEKIQATDLKSVLYDQVRGSLLTEWLLRNGHVAEAAFIPNFMGTLAYTEDSPHMRWYYKWILNSELKFRSLHEEWYINTALWQGLASITNVFAHNEYLFDEVIEKVNQLKLDHIRV